MKTMRRFSLASVIAICALTLVAADDPKKAKDPKADLKGVWVGVTMESNGKAALEVDAKKLQLTIKDDVVEFEGVFDDDHKDVCKYKLDALKSPNHIDITPAKRKKAMRGIYELKDGKLTICIRDVADAGVRPTTFATKPNSKFVLMVLKKKEK